MKIITRLSATLLISLLVAPASMVSIPRVAHAQIPVTDVAHIAVTSAQLAVDGTMLGKDIGLDGIAWVIAKAAVASLVQSTINWINNGFHGSPGFVTNLRETLLQVADSKANQFFNELASGIINSPYQDEIATVVRTGYYLSTSGQFAVQNPFTLDQHSTDPLRFLEGDFDQGGFSAWHAVVLNDQNNPYGAYQLALGELNSRVSSATGKQATELNWYQGFKGLRGDCPAISEKQKAAGIDATTLAEGDAVSLAALEPCQESSILTPGSVIAPQINAAIGAGQNSLITADEIDEIIAALISQLVNKALGAGGLLGVSKPSSGGGRPFIDQAATQQQNAGSSGASAGGTGSTNTEISMSLLTAHEANLQRLNSVAAAALTACGSNTLAQATLTTTASQLQNVQLAIRLYTSGGSNNASYQFYAPTQAEMDQASADIAPTQGSLYTQLVSAPSCGGGSLEWPPVEEPIPTDPPVTI